MKYSYGYGCSYHETLCKFREIYLTGPPGQILASQGLHNRMGIICPPPLGGRGLRWLPKIGGPDVRSYSLHRFNKIDRNRWRCATSALYRRLADRRSFQNVKKCLWAALISYTYTYDVPMQYVLQYFSLEEDCVIRICLFTILESNDHANRLHIRWQYFDVCQLYIYLLLLLFLKIHFQTCHSLVAS